MATLTTQYKLYRIGGRKYVVYVESEIPHAGHKKIRARAPHVPRGQKVAANVYPITMPLKEGSKPSIQVISYLIRRKVFTVRANDQFVTIFVKMGSKIVKRRMQLKNAKRKKNPKRVTKNIDSSRQISNF